MQVLILNILKSTFGEGAENFEFDGKKLIFDGTVNLENTDILFWATIAAVYSE